MSTSSSPTAEAQDSVPGLPPKPFLRFYHSDALRAKTLQVIAAVEQAKDSTKYRSALAALVVELMETGLDYYFMRPLKLAKAGFVVEQSAHVGMKGATKVLGSVIHNIISRMDKAQLLFVCGYMRELME